MTLMQLIWLALLVYLGFRIASFLKPPSRPQANSSAQRGTASVCALHQDPVCGVYVSESDAVVAMHNGQHLYFCSRTCLDKFRENA